MPQPARTAARGKSRCKVGSDHPVLLYLVQKGRDSPQHQGAQTGSMSTPLTVKGQGFGREIYVEDGDTPLQSSPAAFAAWRWLVDRASFLQPSKHKAQHLRGMSPSRVAGFAHAGSCWRRQEGLHTVPQAGTTLSRCFTFSVLLLQDVPTSNTKRAPSEEGHSGAAASNPSCGI